MKACTLGFLAALFLASAVIAAPDSYYDCKSDLDLDGIQDEYEARLLQKFAPRIFLHSNENRWPVSVEWLLGRSTLRYSHDGCGDDSILPYGSVNASNITEQFHQNKHSPFYYKPWKACSHKGRSNSSASYTGGTNDTFFLQYDDGAHNGIHGGPWALYGHAYSKNGYTVLQYWQLYAFNDSFASANHEGDWEFTAVAINSKEVPQSVAFYRHGRVEVYTPDEVQWVGTHHVTYSAKGSHGQYANRVSSGDCDGTRFTDRAQGFADSCDTGFAWDSWDPRFGPIVNIGEKFAPINGANWLRYSGKWGEIGAASDFVKWTSGPPGPAYRDSNHWSWAPPKAVEVSGGVGVYDDNCRMPLYTAVWQPSTEGEIQVYGWTYEDYRVEYDKLWEQGWRLKLLSPYVINNEVRYTAVWQPSTEGEIQVYGWTYEDYRVEYDKLWEQGWRLKLLSPY